MLWLWLLMVGMIDMVATRRVGSATNIFMILCGMLGLMHLWYTMVLLFVVLCILLVLMMLLLWLL
jgi:hypothetical protein